MTNKIHSLLIFFGLIAIGIITGHYGSKLPKSNLSATAPATATTNKFIAHASSPPLGPTLETTDGTHVVPNTKIMKFTSGATVTANGTEADVAISGGGGGSDAGVTLAGDVTGNSGSNKVVGIQGAGVAVPTAGQNGYVATIIVDAGVPLIEWQPAASGTVTTDSTMTGNGTGGSPLSVLATAIVVHQVAHGFTSGTAIYNTGLGTWAAAEANASTTLGIAIAIRTDNDNFTAYLSGTITGLSGLTAGQYYFVSDATPGLLTVTEPVTSTSYSNPLLFATSTTTGIVLPWRPADIATSSGVLAGDVTGALNANIVGKIEGVATATPSGAGNVATVFVSDGGVPAVAWVPPSGGSPSYPFPCLVPTTTTYSIIRWCFSDLITGPVLNRLSGAIGSSQADLTLSVGAPMVTSVPSPIWYGYQGIPNSGIGLQSVAASDAVLEPSSWTYSVLFNPRNSYNASGSQEFLVIKGNYDVAVIYDPRSTLGASWSSEVYFQTTGPGSTAAYAHITTVIPPWSFNYLRWEYDSGTNTVRACLNGSTVAVTDGAVRNGPTQYAGGSFTVANYASPAQNYAYDGVLSQIDEDNVSKYVTVGSVSCAADYAAIKAAYPNLSLP